MNLKMFYIKLTETTYKFCKFANNWIKNPKIKNTSVKKKRVSPTNLFICDRLIFKTKSHT